jgi:predicted adenylyl cyclase CyaB
MTFEVELKARLPDPEETEAIAAQLGTFEAEIYKEDIYFRRRNDASLVPRDRYRLRRQAGRVIVTFKQKVSTGGVVVNKETDFEVDDAHAFFQFADRFGFAPFVAKRKTSRVYKIGRAYVELNHVEYLGYFVEIEILCDEQDQVPLARLEIGRLFNRLGLADEDLEPRYYIMMIQAAHPVRYRFIDDRALDWPFEEIADQTEAEQ